ncbi:MAG: zinc ABC transporter substrate-binding protein [Geminicoccaceae bacterium]|nr:zinc ABC transporter substrate-binding protein [Geminicoccaceae bacterium]
MARGSRHLLTASVALAVSAAAQAGEPPRVVASILPLHALAASVMEGVASPSLLVPPGASPHSFQLKPSDARRLQEADLVLWVGPMLETFLEKPLATLGSKALIVEVARLPGIALLPVREGGVWAEHAHDHGHERGTKAELAHQIDGHLWLDPMNGAVVVKALGELLAERDSERGAIYRARARQEVERLEELDRALASRLAAVKDEPFVVFHDAYQYFERRYGLSAAGSITVSPERQPSAKRLANLRRTIRERGAVCVFAEPQFKAPVVASVVEGTGARTAMLDPVGASPLQPGPGAYRALLKNLAEDLAGCLMPTG